MSAGLNQNQNCRVCEAPADDRGFGKIIGMKKLQDDYLKSYYLCQL